MPNQTLLQLALLVFCVSVAGYAANTTTASAPGASASTGVSVEHDLPHPLFEEAEVLSAGGWTIKLLPAYLIPLQASRDGEVVLLRDPIDNSYYRWVAGFLENLGQSSDDRVSMNNAGITAATNYRSTALYYHSFVKTWRRDDKTFNYLYNPVLFSKYTPPLNNGETPASIRYSRSVSLLQVDDAERLWVVADEEAGGPSMIATVDRSGTLRKVYATNYAGVSRTGHSLASVPDESGHRKYYLDERQVDFEPTFVNDNGIATAYALTDTWHSAPFIVYPDGRQEPVPKDPSSPSGSPLVVNPWIDSQGRLNGANNRGYAPVLVEKKLGADGQPVVPTEYVLATYESLPFPPTSTWTTDHKIAPRTYAPQVGIAVDSATGISRPFIATLKARLGVDANRDGIITSGPESGGDEVSQEAPYRFWINDDDDEDATSGDDAPGKSAGATSQAGTSGANFSTVEDNSSFKDTGWIDGARDLIDFFPVVLDLGQLIPVGPSDGAVKYKFKHEDEAVNVVVTSLRRADALKFQTDAQLANEVLALQTHKVTAQGYEIEPRYLELYKNSDYGVVLVEGRKATDRPLVLSVEIDGAVIAEVKLHLKISPVESMFRHMNLRDRNLPGLVGTKKDSAESEMMKSPAGFPDDPSSDGRWLIFVHGFNVSGKGARGWNAEMFKRCYWAGNMARFIGVSWFGNPDPGKVGLPADYHLAVRNAMVTAPLLAQAINDLPGGSDTKTIFAHSLGCGVVSSAIADHDMNIRRACFVDSALALESFDGRNPSTFSTENAGMTPAVWRPYDPALYASNWFSLFDPATDARGKLTWSNRFTRTDGGQKDASPFIYHFYSSTEDVLAEYSGELPSTLGEIALDSGTHGSFGWVFQEKGKGNRQNYGLIVTELTHLGSYYGGWGMNLKDPVLGGDTPYWKWVNSDNYIGRVIKTPAEIGPISVSVLRRHPVFEPGWGTVRNQEQQESPVSYAFPVDGAPSWILDLYGASIGNTTAADPLKRNQLLAEAIPALTWCMGSHESSGLQSGRNLSLPSLIDQTNWPRDKINNVLEWRHSDMREVAYLYQYGVFDKIIAISKP